MYLPPDPAGRTTYVAGDVAQFDLWFPPITLPVGFGHPHADAAAGADDGARLLPLGRRGADPDAHRRGPDGRLVAADRGPGGGSAGAGVGRRERGRPLARRAQRSDAGLPGVPRHACHQGRDLPARRPRGQGSGRAAARLPQALVPARPHLHRPGRLQQSDQQLAGDREHAAAKGARVRPDPPDHRGRAAMLPLPPVPPATGWRISGRLARTTTCAWTATTTRSTRPSSAVASRLSLIWSASGCSATAGSSPTTSGSEPSTRRCPRPRTSLRPERCAPSGSDCCARRLPQRTRSSSGR